MVPLLSIQSGRAVPTPVSIPACSSHSCHEALTILSWNSAAWCWGRELSVPAPGWMKCQRQKARPANRLCFSMLGGLTSPFLSASQNQHNYVFPVHLIWHQSGGLSRKFRAAVLFAWFWHPSAMVSSEVWWVMTVASSHWTAAGQAYHQLQLKR